MTGVRDLLNADIVQQKVKIVTQVEIKMVVPIPDGGTIKLGTDEMAAEFQSLIQEMFDEEFGGITDDEEIETFDVDVTTYAEILNLNRPTRSVGADIHAHAMVVAEQILGCRACAQSGVGVCDDH